MKKLIILIAILHVVCIASSQKLSDNSYFNKYSKSLSFENTFPSKGIDKSPSRDGNFNKTIIEYSSSNIRADSIVNMINDNGNIEIYNYDASGRIINFQQKNLNNGVFVNSTKISYTYDDHGNNLTELWQDWSNVQDEWINDYLYTYTYDIDNNMLSNLFQEWENNSWINFIIYTYSYEDNGLLQTKLETNWVDNNWLDSRLWTSVIDAYGNIVEETLQHWINDEWLFVALYSYSFDEGGNLLVYLWQFWQNDEWENYKLTTYTYDTDGNNLTHSLQKWEDEAWVNNFIYSYTYDSEGNRLTWLNQVGLIDGGWQNIGLRNYNYDPNGNLLSVFVQYWQSDQWINQDLYTYSYNENGELLIYILQEWYDNNWINEYKNEYSYQPGLINAISYEWNLVDLIWENGYLGNSIDIIIDGEIIYSNNAIEINYYYSMITGIEDQVQNVHNSNILCYPNPVTNDVINLKIDEGWFTSNISIELGSLTGQKLKAFEFNVNDSFQEIRINVGDIPTGFYILQINTETLTYSQKIIIAK